MKKLSYLIILALVLGLVLTGCSLLSNISQVPATEQSGITYLTKGVPPTPSTSLVGLWHFDGDALDSSGNNNHGTASEENWVDGKFGNALSFNGVNNYVDCGNDSSLNITQGTWEAWIKFDALPSVAGHPMNPLAKANQYWIHGSRNDTDSGTTDAIVVKIRVNGTRYCVNTSSNFIVEDTWYHVAGTYDGETLKLYVNGTLVDSNTAPSGDIDTGTQIMAVGTWSTLVDYFQGTIDEVRIWNEALDSGQIAQSYALGTEQPDATVVELGQEFFGDEGDEVVIFTSSFYGLNATFPANRDTIEIYMMSNYGEAIEDISARKKRYTPNGTTGWVGDAEGTEGETFFSVEVGKCDCKSIHLSLDLTSGRSVGFNAQFLPYD